MIRTVRLLATMLLAAAHPAHAQAAMPANSAADSADWWKRAVIYEVYPRSFADSDNSGVGGIDGKSGW